LYERASIQIWILCNLTLAARPTCRKGRARSHSQLRRNQTTDEQRRRRGVIIEFKIEWKDGAPRTNQPRTPLISQLSQKVTLPAKLSVQCSSALFNRCRVPVRSPGGGSPPGWPSCESDRPSSSPFSPPPPLSRRLAKQEPSHALLLLPAPSLPAPFSIRPEFTLLRR
jgi:hypothetical protein